MAVVREVSTTLPPWRRALKAGVVPGDEGEVAVQGARQPGERRALVGLVEAVPEFVGGGAQRGLVQLLLAAGEVPVHQRPGDPGGLGHVVQRDVLGDAVREQRQGRLQQLAAALLDTEATVGGGGGAHDVQRNRPPRTAPCPSLPVRASFGLPGLACDRRPVPARPARVCRPVPARPARARLGQQAGGLPQPSAHPAQHTDVVEEVRQALRAWPA